MLEPSRPFPELEPTPTEPPKYERTPSKVTFTTDNDGQAIALVPIHGSTAPAELYADDYHTLINAGVSPNWSYARYHIRRKTFWHVHCPSGCEALVYTRSGASHVARLIAGADVGEKVLHRDKNPLNLRRDNLRIT